MHKTYEVPFEHGESEVITAVIPLFGRVQKANTKYVRPLKLNDKKVNEMVPDGEKDVFQSPISQFCTLKNKKLPNSFESYKKMLSKKKKKLESLN